MNHFHDQALAVCDLTRIEGINTAVAEVLNAAGISNYADLSKTPVVKVKEILSNAGVKYSFRDPATWPKQAALAEAGQWHRLYSWQEELQGGRVRLALTGPEEEE
jgi:predicted flap endonuclease-1-like 5' DNA nuclease